MKPIYVVVSLLLLTNISFTANAKELVDLNTFPKWFKDSVAREIKVINDTTLTIEEFNVSHKVMGKVKLVEKVEGTWYYNIDIGTASPIECYVFTEFDGPANSLHAIVESAIEGAETLNKKKLNSTFNFAVDSGVIGYSPYLLLDTLYSLGEGDKKVSGVIKGLSAQTNNSLQICLHNEVGYRQTFFSVFSSFIEAFQSSEKNTYFFNPIYLMSLNNIPIGYGSEKYTLDQDGDVEITTETSTIFPIDSKSLSRSDTVTRSWSNPDGSLINETTHSVENGTLESQFSLIFNENNWHVEGELQGKPIKSTLNYDGWLLSNYGSYLETADLNKSDNSSANFNMWVPEADPTAETTVTLTKITNNPPINFELNMGPISIQYHADDKGVLQQGNIKQSIVDMQMKLIYVLGEPNIK